MLRNIAVVSLMMLLSGCGTSPKSNFYMLNVENDSVTSAVTDKSVSVGVWPVMIPEYIDRSEIVTRDDAYEISIADFERWAASLQKNMTQLIAGELSRRLKSDEVFIAPWESYRSVEYQVKIYSNRFDGELGGEAVLQGTWSLLNAEDSKEVNRQTFMFQQQSLDKTHKALVKALSSLTVQLAEQIANTIAEQKHQ